MKNTYLKKIAVACVATLAFFGIQSSMVMAMENNDAQANKINQTEEIQSFFDIQTPNEYTENPEKQVNHAIIKDQDLNIHDISSSEKDLLSRLVEAEAKGESYEGKVAVAEVVLNRVDSPEFPDTITNVVYEVVGDAYAFSPVQNGEIKKPASDEAKSAVEDALSSSEERLNQAVYFYNPEIASDEWIRSRQVVKKIDNHVFAK